MSVRRTNPQFKIEGGFLRPRVEKLLVSTRDCTKLVVGVLKQVDIVRGIIGDDVPIHGVLCFVEADWPLIGGSFTTRGVEALRPKRLYPKLKADGPLLRPTVAKIHRHLASYCHQRDQSRTADAPRRGAMTHSGG